LRAEKQVQAVVNEQQACTTQVSSLGKNTKASIVVDAAKGGVFK
jgi:hypothetical protein